MTCSLAFVSPHLLSPSPQCGEGELRTPLSSPSPYGGVVILSERAARARAKDLLAVASRMRGTRERRTCCSSDPATQVVRGYGAERQVLRICGTAGPSRLPRSG